MKFLSILYFSFFPFCIFGQTKNAVALKIYVSDAQTGKNIPDAKVTLEGYEISPVTGSYNKTGSYYYFKQIPDGYNTVMVYHNKYNETGFQDLAVLPKVLKLKLQDYRYVSYSFEKPVLKEIRKDYIRKSKYLEKIGNNLLKKDSVEGKNFRYLYSEDPFHIAIISKYNSEDFFGDERIKKLLNELSLEQTIYRFGTPKEYKLTCYSFAEWSFYKSQYREENTFNSCESDLGFTTKYMVYFFHKKDKTKFSRYNCKEIQELRKAKLKVAVLTNRTIEYFADAPFNPRSFDLFYNHNIRSNIYRDSIDNYEFGLLKKPEQVFFQNSKQENEMFFGKSGFRTFEGADNDNSISSLFFVVLKNTDSGTGLGVLDTNSQYRINDGFYFFNKIYGIPLE